jgi:hypothetical protein
MEMKDVWLGAKAAIISSSCCSFPIALVLLFSALGAGSATAALKIPKYRWYFIALGTTFLLVSLYLRIRKRSGGTCGMRDLKRERQAILVAIASYIVLTTLVIYLVLPLISAWVFG